MFLHVCISMISDPGNKIPSLLIPGSIYKQKVKVREEIEEADQYDYGISSLRSLKAFEWLSLDHYSSDESPVSVVRIPGSGSGSDLPKSPTPGFRASKEEINKNNRAPVGGRNKNVRATSAPRRLCSGAVLSSPDRNGVPRSKTQARRELLSPLKSHDSCLDRHTRCKISTRCGDAEVAPPHLQNKHPTESKKHVRVKGRPTPADEKQQKRKG